MLGRKFLLRVDHSALTHLRTTTELMGQAARWLQFIEEYDFEIMHRSGTSHGNCDALSRRPHDESEYQEKIRRIAEKTNTGDVRETELTPETIATEQRKDPALKLLINSLLTTNQLPSWTDIQSESEETKALWAQFESSRIQNEMLQRQFYSRDGSIMAMHTVMPNSLRQTFLHALHNTGGNVGTTHLGIKKRWRMLERGRIGLIGKLTLKVL